MLYTIDNIDDMVTLSINDIFRLTYKDQILEYRLCVAEYGNTSIYYLSRMCGHISTLNLINCDGILNKHNCSKSFLTSSGTIYSNYGEIYNLINLAKELLHTNKKMNGMLNQSC